MPSLDPQQRAELTRLVIALLDDWGVAAADQLRLLALPEGTRAGMVRQYRNGAPFPESAGVMERIEHLVGIADALRTSFPRNAGMGALWMNRPHRWFDGRTPLTAMLEDGLDGVIAVRTHLDCAYDWNLSGSRS